MHLNVNWCRKKWQVGLATKKLLSKYDVFFWYVLFSILYIHISLCSILVHPLYSSTPTGRTHIRMTTLHNPQGIEKCFKIPWGILIWDHFGRGVLMEWTILQGSWALDNRTAQNVIPERNRICRVPVVPNDQLQYFPVLKRESFSETSRLVEPCNCSEISAVADKNLFFYVIMNWTQLQLSFWKWSCYRRSVIPLG